MTKFEKIVRYTNKQTKFTRQQMLKEIAKENGYDEITFDQYRNYLTQAGYIKWLSRGKYKRIREIPFDLTSRQCRREAYPWTNRVKQ